MNKTHFIATMLMIAWACTLNAQETAHEIMQPEDVKVSSKYPANSVYGFSAFGDYSGFTGTLPISSGNFEPLENVVVNQFLSCGDYIRGTVFGIEYQTNRVYIIQPDGALELVDTIKGLSDDIVTGIAYDQVNDHIYVSVHNNQSYLYVGDHYWNFTPVGPMGPGLYIGIAADHLGNLYGIEMMDDVLASIDKMTGTATTIGPLGIDITLAQDIGGNYKDGTLYGTLYSSGGRFGTIDKKTGRFHEINYFKDEITVCAVIPGIAASFIVDDGIAPVDSALVIIGSDTIATNENGEAVHYLAEGDHSYTVIKKGFEKAEGTFILNETDVDLQVSLAPAKYDITFHVTDEQEPVEGALVSIVDDEQLTDAGGNAILSLSTGSYSYTVTKVGYRDVTGNVEVFFDTLAIKVPMQKKTYSVTFIVSGTQGGIEGAEVALSGTGIQHTGAEGIAIFGELHNGTYNYTVTANNHHEVTGSLEVADQDVTETVSLVPLNTANWQGDAISIRPNPSAGLFSIHTPESYTVIVINSSGQQIYEKNIDGTGRVHLSEPGIYIMRFENGNRCTTRTLIVK